MDTQRLSDKVVGQLKVDAFILYLYQNVDLIEIKYRVFNEKIFKRCFKEVKDDSADHVFS